MDLSRQHGGNPGPARDVHQELLADVPVYPLTQTIALLAGRIDAEQQYQGVKIPFQDLLIGVTGLYLGYTVVTVNTRHFRMIPNLVVQQL